jgi:hypothetical protein
MRFLLLVSLTSMAGRRRSDSQHHLRQCSRDDHLRSCCRNLLGGIPPLWRRHLALRSITEAARDSLSTSRPVTLQFHQAPDKPGFDCRRATVYLGSTLICLGVLRNPFPGEARPTAR